MCTQHTICRPIKTALHWCKHTPCKKHKTNSQWCSACKKHKWGLHQTFITHFKNCHQFSLVNCMAHLYKEDQHSTIPSLVVIKSRWDLKFSGGAWSINYKTVFIFGGNEIKWRWISSSADIWSSLPWRSSRALPSRWGGQGPVGCCNGLDLNTLTTFSAYATLYLTLFTLDITISKPSPLVL